MISYVLMHFNNLHFYSPFMFVIDIFYIFLFHVSFNYLLWI